MAKNKIGLHFSGFEETIATLKKLEGDVKSATEKALVESQAIVAEKARQAMNKHHRTGDTEESIIADKKVEWEGFTASIGVGFDISNGGLASVFLMYGTPKHAPNHPGTEEDKELYDSVYGKKTQKQVGEAQANIFYAAIAERMG